ncbi:uncharacterized protein CMU_019350 [Cryptosporidium muris RN66]|uniref:2-phosphoglycerate kinase n=1 Tax=Cryptosporidium muris (strain RN66) TaxID=441375 RepID=B6ACC2_CRYMR|nr:uncharacterized protein CMU_019350 [Cryptosporidium muris RN66]EEA06178.1 hypothetical protein, conserved [Cryptosporidium muris RN66]|eukprot:XP_002140527.1 hypothetical protein [Cryptosporidium muris RN66]
MTETEKILSDAFTIRKLLLSCQVYEEDIQQNIINYILQNESSISNSNRLLLLCNIVNKKIKRDILKQASIILRVFSSKLAIIPLICGIFNSSKSSVALNLAYYLNIPNVVLTKTVRKTLSICYKSTINENIQDIEDYYKECNDLACGFLGDITKAIKQGKSVIFCGFHLNFPLLFQLNSNSIFPQPIFVNSEDSQISFPIYFRPSENNSANVLFIPFILKLDREENSRIYHEQYLYQKNMIKTLEFEDQLIQSILHNNLNLPIHTVKHNPKRPEITSKEIHSIILHSLNCLENKI